MEQSTKRNLILGGSIAAAVLIGLGTGIGAGYGIWGNNNTNTGTAAANSNGVGAFSNLDSFTNDGFNNGVLTSATEYSEFETTQSGLEQKTSSYSGDGHEYVDMIESYYSTNDIIISAGFQVANAITGADSNYDGIIDFGGVFTDKDGNNTSYANSSNKAFVLLDDAVLASQYTNAASISFAAEGAGYAAGIAASLYTHYDAYYNHGDKTKITDADYTPNIVMWGGMAFNTVYDFMSGFAQGVTEYNDANEILGLDGATDTDIVLWSGGGIGADPIEGTDTTDYGVEISADNSYDGKGGNVDTWYTGGFDADASTTNGTKAQSKTTNAINNDASVVFPIAGGNTSVAEAIVSANKKDSSTKMMGVDADSTLSAADPSVYLGTAEKNLVLGGQYGLWAMDDYNKDGIRNYEEYKHDPSTYTDDFLDAHKGDDGMDKWIDDSSNPYGAQFRGTASNGGVGFLVGGDKTTEGVLLTAYNELTGLSITEDELQTMIDEGLMSAPAIESADKEFVPVPAK